MNSLVSRQSLLLTAAVATLFSMIVALLLIRDLVHRSQVDMVETTTIVALRDQLREEPGDQERRERLRDDDVALRKTYFRSRQFMRRGAYLLAGGIGLAVLAGTVATTLGRRVLPPSAVSDEAESASREKRIGVRAVAALAGVLAVGILWIAFSFRTTLSLNPEDLSVAGTPNSDLAGDSRGAMDTPPAPQAPAATDLPSQEEIQSNWPTFRGPQGAGTVLTPQGPIDWDVNTGEGVVWKTSIPLPGNNSPVVWGDRVFVTGATSERREVFCLDSKNGELLWQHNVDAGAENAPEPVEVSEDTGYAAPTAATDGRRVFAIFAQGDLAALDVNGKPLWSRSLGAPKNIYGHAASLALAGELLIVQLDQGSKKDRKSKLLAVNVQSGETVWEAAREVPNSWSSPVVIQHEGQSRIITCGDPWVIAYAVEDGREIWRANCLRQDVGPTPVYSNGVVIAANEFPGISAIRFGGQGDVTESHVQWTVEFGAPDTSSPLVSDGLLIVLASYGTLTCYDMDEGGEPLWEEDFDDNFRSSPTRIGDFVYLFGESGKVWVVRATQEECTSVSESDLGESCVTSPAVVGGHIFVRGEEHLFCLGGS